MNILITGGCGFIGSDLAAFHLSKGDHVYIVDDLSTGSLKNIAAFKDNPRFHFDKASILKWPEMNEAIQWSDGIYHLAAVIGIFRVLAEPINVVDTNIRGSELLFSAIAANGGNKKIIFASSPCVYGEAIDLSEDNDLIIRQVGHPLLAYGISKLAIEIVAAAYYKAMKLPITVIRFFNVVGPRQTGRYGMVVPRFINQVCNNEPITIFGDGTQTRSFCDVRDAITAVNLLAENDTTVGEVFNVGTPHEVSINELARIITKLAGSSSVFTYVPYLDAYGSKFTDTPQRRPIIDKLHKFIDFKHQWSLEKTINDLILLERNSNQA
jgi:UDP-glucose 4-epimerase